MDEPNARSEEFADLDDLAHRRLTPKQRLVRALNIGFLLVLALNVFTGHAASLLHHATSPVVPPPVPQANHLYLDLDVPWLAVTVDGSTQRVYAVGTGLALTLAPGRHVIAWSAEPFLPQSCVLTVPAAPADTCTPLLEGALPLPGPTSNSAQVLHAGEWLATVQPAARAALIAALQAALAAHDGTDIIQAGERYVAERHGVATATAPLRAALSYTLDTDPDGTLDSTCRPDAARPATSACLVDPQYCRRLCALPWPLRGWGAALLPPPEWLVLAVYHSTWTYSTLDGRPAGGDSPPDALGSAVADKLALVHITWDAAGWHAQAYFGGDLSAPLVLAQRSIVADPGCYAGEDVFSGTVSSIEHGVYLQVRAVTGSNLAVGCALAATVSPAFHSAGPTLTPTLTPTPTAPRLALYLYRFGILLAANDLAHQLRPALPLANASERQLALQLAAKPGRVIYQA